MKTLMSYIWGGGVKSLMADKKGNGILLHAREILKPGRTHTAYQAAGLKPLKRGGIGKRSEKVIEHQADSPPPPGRPGV